MLKVYVRTRHRDDAAADRVRQHAAHYGDLDISPRNEAVDYWQFLRDVMAECEDPYFVACHDDVVLPRNFGRQVAALVAELEAGGTPWGIVGNAGISVNGKQIFRFISDVFGGPGTSAVPLAVAMLDGNCLLINRRAFSEKHVEIPDLSGFHGYDIALAAESWRAGLAVLADRRLFVVHNGRGNMAEWTSYVTGKEFSDYWLRRCGPVPALTINGLVIFEGPTDARPLNEAIVQTIKKHSIAWSAPLPAALDGYAADLERADLWADLVEMLPHADPINRLGNFPMTVPPNFPLITSRAQK